ncbi:MAG: glycosyltransferase family 4 protein [Marinobacter sp.]|nr:glycosyltransferase family 4 protein [Marinobacter sp.]
MSSAILQAVEQRVPEAETILIPSSFSGYPASAECVSAIRQRFSGKVLVGQVGRLLQHKGYHVTIEAARQLANYNPEIQFLFIGEGPDEDWLRELATGVPNIEFTGFQQDVGNWLAALDVFVFPSLSEGLGSTILEAMQHKVPVIGARAGGIPDLITDGENGILVEPGDPDALRDAIEGLVTNAGKRSALVECATSGLAIYSPQAISKRYQALYGALV